MYDKTNQVMYCNKCKHLITDLNYYERVNQKERYKRSHDYICLECSDEMVDVGEFHLADCIMSPYDYKYFIDLLNRIEKDESLYYELSSQLDELSIFQPRYQTYEELSHLITFLKSKIKGDLIL